MYARQFSGSQTVGGCALAVALLDLIQQRRPQVLPPAEQTTVVDFREELFTADGQRYCPFSDLIDHGAPLFERTSLQEVLPPDDVASESLKCPLCHENFEDPVVLPGCGHSFCLSCAGRMLRAPLRQTSCPLCRKPIAAALTPQQLIPNWTARSLVAELPTATTIWRCRWGVMHAPGDCGSWVPDPEGCPAQLGSYAEEQEHSKECEFTIACCVFTGCRFVLRKRDVPIHNRSNAEAHAAAELNERIRLQAVARSLRLAANAPGGDVHIRVFVETLTGKVFEVSLPPACSVWDLKERVEDIYGSPPDQQQLIFDGRQLEVGRLLDEHKIVSGSRVHLVLRLRGSDVRLKVDVRATGRRRHAGALKEYTWQWNDVARARGYADTEPRGVLAHEVQALMQAAVVADAEGYLLVDYEALLP